MALLFEKCERATQTPEKPSSESFDVDIQAFVQHQEQDQKPFFSEDPELDSVVSVRLYCIFSPRSYLIPLCRW
jgi:hypothetical protein